MFVVVVVSVVVFGKSDFLRTGDFSVTVFAAGECNGKLASNIV